MKYCKDTYQPKLSWQESREKDPCCVHVQSLRRLKCKEVMICGLEKNRLKRLSQSSVCVWLTKTDKTKIVNDLKKKRESSFSSCHSCPLSSLLFQVLTYISCTLCDSCLLSELRNYLSVFILQLMFSFTSCAAEVSLDWKQSFISHLPHRFKCNNTVVIMTQTQLLT